MDYRACSEASTNITSNRPKNYRKWSEKERYEIGKYAAIHGSRAAERKFHTKEKPISQMPRDSLSCTKRKYRKHKRIIVMLIEIWISLDQMVQIFLLSLRRTGGLVFSAVAISAAKALIARNPQYNLSHIDLDSSNWELSLFRRTGFKK